MNLQQFKLLTLEERLDYLFEHSVKDQAQRFADEQDKWRKKDCTCDTPFGCNVHDEPPVEHPVIGVCGCGAPAHTLVNDQPVCFPCGYHLAN